MSLKDDRVVFTSLVATLLVWMRTATWGEWNTYEKVEVAVDEWTIHSPRPFRLTHPDGTTEILKGWDGVHMIGGKHPLGLACDLVVWLDGVYLEDGAHPIWREIDARARSMRPDFGMGIKFRDSNHLSLGEGF